MISTAAARRVSQPRTSEGNALGRAISDTLVLTRRHLRHIPRSPELLVFATIQPVMFVVLFRYDFGGAINVTGTSYVNFLMPGIFVQTVAFGSMLTGSGLAQDQIGRAHV